MKSATIDAETLKALLAYDPATGVFRWRCSRNSYAGKVMPGDIAGHIRDNGYRIIGLNGRIYRAHRLAWLYTHDQWPVGLIDHVNGDRDDNRIANLRQASVSENAQNIKEPHRDSECGYLGVYRSTSAFIASIMIEGKKRHLGSYRTAEEAHAAYLRAKAEVHPFWTKQSEVRA